MGETEISSEITKQCQLLMWGTKEKQRGSVLENNGQDSRGSKTWTASHEESAKQVNVF